MRQKLLFAFVLFCAVALQTVASNREISIIPQPQEMKAGEGDFTFKKTTKVFVPVYANDSIKMVADRFGADLKVAAGIRFVAAKNAKKADIVLFLDKNMSAEAYQLNVEKKQISVRASHPQGFFYAFQTLKQMMPANVLAGKADAAVTKWSVPVVSIKDEPQFGWRGFMLDEGRHFFGVDEIKRVLNVMAAYKMNRFHWHLTEDQGWRVEIKKYPKLTEVGATRNTKRLAWDKIKTDGLTYSGYYTQEQVKDIVKYAKNLFIEIVPEVDIPGHSQAAVAAYPEFLACDPEAHHEVWLSQGVSKDVINVANPKAVQWAKDVIDELIEMFPFGYIHLGGDECPTKKWENNRECQEMLKSIKSENYRDLQIEFYRQLKDYIAQKPAKDRRTMIFWNEVLHGNVKPLGKDIVIMAWLGADKAALHAAEMGLNTILTPQIPYYINRKQSKAAGEPLTQGNGSETVEAVYDYIPLKNVPDNLKKYYMGVQANCWTEYVEDNDLLEYLIFPRLMAVAEAAWTNQSERSYPDFVKRINLHQPLFNLWGIKYGKHIMK